VRDTNPAQKGSDQMKRVAVGWDSDRKDYTDAVMKAWAEKTGEWDIDALSLHNYVLDGWPPHLKATGFSEDDYAKSLKEALRMDDKIVHQSAIMDRYDPQKKVALSVDEWGIWLAPTPGSNPGFLQQQNSLRDAILASVTLDIFMRHADRVRMANIAQMINVLQAMVLTDGPKMLLTPTYYVYKMYLPFQDATFVPIRYDGGTYRVGDRSMPQLDAVAARDTRGQLWLAVTNINPEKPADLVLDVSGMTVGSAQGQVLTAAQIDSVNTFAAPNAVAPKPIAAVRQANTLRLTMPPKSVAVLALRP
jgi:alpha-L-arabinofuranosidase